MHHHNYHYPNCLNCGHELAEHYKFCPNCGQHPTDGKTSFGHLVSEFFEGVFHLDGKLITTLRHVFIPGKLTEEFFKGRHKSYAAPLQLFFVLGGLFFVLISSKLHESEEKLQTKFENIKTFFLVKKILGTSDSINKTFDIYQKQPDVKIFADSVIKKAYFKYNAKADVQIANDYSTSLRKLKEARINANKNLTQVQRDSVIKKLKKDSVVFIESIADEKDISNEAAEKLAKYYTDSIVQLKKNQQDIVSINIKDDSKNILKSDSINLFTEFFNKNHKSYKVSEADIYNLKDKELLEKYHVEGFISKLFVRQTAHFFKSGGDIINYFLSKSLWIILASILPIAFFLKLLYIRRHKFLIEHFLFLMHFLCFCFIVGIVYWGLPMLVEKIAGAAGTESSKYKTLSYIFTTLYTLSIPIGLWLAMKQFYKQGWLKTSFKFFIFIIGAYTIGVIVAIFGLALGLAMF